MGHGPSRRVVTLEQVSAPGIESYALLSDCQGSALVSRDGSVDWACVPRFDSPSSFARLLDPDAGHWRVAPTEAATMTRAYVDGTLVLRTVFDTEEGSAALTDALVLGPGEEGHEIGKGSPHVLVRVVEGLSGSVQMQSELSPRPEYGLTTPRLSEVPGGLRLVGGEQALALSGHVRHEISGGAAVARFTVRAGERQAFSLHVCSPWAPHPAAWSDTDIVGALDGTVRGWQSWTSAHQTYDGPYAEAVRHSGRVLQGLTCAPSGAVVAAPTTSLPEAIGGGRNWDYRYCWVRDASLTLEALWVAACPDEAAKFFEFFTVAAGGRVAGGSGMQIMYGLRGERLLPETELGHLAGFRDSRPVRIGNNAWFQAQLDIYGELLNAALMLREQVGEFGEAEAALLVDVADTAAARWQEPDQGIWELRGEPRQVVHSKLMCWVALDRAVQLAPALGAALRSTGGHGGGGGSGGPGGAAGSGGPGAGGASKVEAWRQTAAEIRDAIESHGWSDTAGAFTQSFDSDDLDASTLLVAITGFLPTSDPRMRSTIDAVASRLTDSNGFVRRYLSDDMEGAEGTFTICTFWLVQCLAMAGEVDRARALFERVIGHANDVGLLSEQLDSDSGALLGNFPQAFTHVGLVNAAWAIAQAMRSAADG